MNSVEVLKLIKFILFQIFIIIFLSCTTKSSPVDIDSGGYGPDLSNYEGTPSHIWVMYKDGSQKVSLTKDKTYDTKPQFSPDGSKILYYSKINYDEWFMPEFDLWIMDSDGSNKINLTNSMYTVFSAKFSPDGSKIAFEIDDNIYNPSGNNIYICNCDGSNKKNIHKGSDPQFSPDGSKLIFSNNDYIYIANSDGSNLKELVRGSHPNITPDGSKIIFSRPDIVEGFLIGFIYVIDTDGNNLTKITMGDDPKLSPLGGKILFNRADYYEDYTYRERDLYIVDLDGKNEILLEENVQSDYYYMFLPDGSVIFKPDTGPLMRANDDGTNTRRFPFFSDLGRYSSYPNGREIVYASSISDGDNEIYLVDINIDFKLKLTNNNVNDVNPNFSNDGHRIVYNVW